ncbi:helix-turn-helix domain-containing protein [Patulibacter sp. SYSU D01012]|uniref:GlxA family transcriptional regulator n=1 Tax=Patulibacter sp. SYSU D01012 TaxID=2817381 RepID=UPI001B3136D0|nr:helix-turn-helix domain-containing protein [Patulibacter sp. SYSU D01012]
MRTVAVVAFDGVIVFDLATAVETFGFARRPDGGPAYRVRVCAAAEEVSAGAFALRAPWRLDALADADTVVVPGVRDPLAPVDDALLDALRAAAPRARIASICTGAFVLAAAGLLDGLRATTHWAAAELLAARFPQVAVDPDVLYVDNGDVLTSAGAAAGLDLCLHMIRRDHGAAVAADAARAAVMPLERAGGQAQFIVHRAPDADGGSLAPLLAWMEEHAGERHTLEALAARAHMSPRTLSRRFREQTGTTPLQWLHRARLRRAQGLLETTDEPVERIADLVGYGSPTAFRERFRALCGTSPQAYRRAFRGGGAPAAASPAPVLAGSAA